MLSALKIVPLFRTQGKN